MNTFEHPTHAVHMAEVSSVEEIVVNLKTIKDLLHERFEVTRMGIFGSFAQETQTTASDIDMVMK